MHATVHQENVAIGSLSLPGLLDIPADSRGLVLFAHGSGSSRLSVRNERVADVLWSNGLSTLRFDLLTGTEAEDRRNVFDIALLSSRVESALDWVAGAPATADMDVGLFGASTGAAAALSAAAARPGRVAAVVSRGGRPDLAQGSLERVQAPTLLIVGGADPQVLALNREALGRLRGTRRLEVIPGASHLFEEPGTLDSVAMLAAQWFDAYLARGPVA